MANPKNYEWDPRKFTLIAVGLPISGFTSDDMAELIPDDPMATKTEVSPQGDTVVIKSANKLYRLKFTLMSADPLNKVLYAAADALTRGPFVLKSLSDGRAATGAVSYVEGKPSPKFSRGHQGLEWTIAIPQCDVT